jgi:hypothetical protein
MARPIVRHDAYDLLKLRFIDLTENLENGRSSGDERAAVSPWLAER